MASKIYRVNATKIRFIFVLCCIVLYCCHLDSLLEGFWEILVFREAPMLLEDLTGNGVVVVVA